MRLSPGRSPTGVALPGYALAQLVYESSRTLVVRATRAADERSVILKLLRAEQVTPENLARQQREYDVLGSLHEPGVIRSLGLEHYQKGPALVLEDFGGASLDRLLDDWGRVGSSTFPLSRFLDVAVQATTALGQVHAAEFIHQALSLGNIVLNPTTGELKLIDFELAAALGSSRGTNGSLGVDEKGLAYLAPEQTGRMHCGSDERTDLYSLGVCFYELLSGELPFAGDDTAALAHAHVARMPRPLGEANPAVPKVLAEIVHRMMAKDPGDRYQSALGLRADLDRLRSSLRESRVPTASALPSFELAQHDHAGRLQLPPKLYGREAEQGVLLGAFDRAAAGARELLFVAGGAGVGKSSLVMQVQRPIVERGGYFVGGKFDAYQQNTPYAAFTQAFNRLADLLLTEPEAALESWRDRLRKAAAGNGALLCEVIPNLEQVIGRQSPVAPLSGQESRNRFHLTFRSLLRCFGAAGRPLLVFLDDAQWADPASLELLTALLTDVACSHVLFVAAYRDNEVGPGHPLGVAVSNLAAAGVVTRTIEIGGLHANEIQALLQDGLECPAAECRALAEVVCAQTRGNPLFARQLVQNLFAERRLRFDFEGGRWTWDLAEIQVQQVSDDVLGLMTARIAKLQPVASRWLSLAACVGSDLRLRTLARIGRASEAVALAELTEALREGLLVRLDDSHEPPHALGGIRLGFLHDRVRQAVYGRIPEAERQRLHLAIGDVLVGETRPADLDRRVFDAVQHYKQAIALIGEPEKRVAVAELNVRAADIAYRAAAFQSAAACLHDALALQPAGAWDGRHSWMLSCSSRLATCLALSGDFGRLESVAAEVEAHARTITETTEVTLARIGAAFSQGKLVEAIALGLDFVEASGVPINRAPSREEAFAYLRETADWLTEARIAGIPQLPDGPPGLASVLQVAVTINGAVYGTNAELCLVFVSHMTRLCLEQGLAPWAPVTLATFALLLCAALHDVPKAKLLTEATQRLFEERYRSASLVPSLASAVAGFVVHRHQHLKNTVPLFEEGVREGLTAGSFEFVAFCAWWHSWHHLFLGTPLARCEAIARQAVETCREVHMERLADWCRLVHQVTLNLQGQGDSPWILDGAACRERQLMDAALGAHDNAEAFRIRFYKAWLQFLLAPRGAGAAAFREAEALLPYAVGLYLVPLFHFYDALATAAACSTAEGGRDTGAIERIGADLQALEVWVSFAPMNHQHKKDLVEAELARLSGQNWQAVDLYQRAIRGAEEQGFLSEEALAHELTGRFWLERGNPQVAWLHLQEAARLYRLWGARPKAQQLQREIDARLAEAIPRWMPSGGQEVPDDRDRPPWWRRVAPESRIDVSSLLKANQTLSQTVDLADLLATMLRGVLENAGAERALALSREESGWYLIGSGRIDGERIEVDLHLPVSQSPELSQSVFNYVVHSGKAIVLDTAAEAPEFASDPYLRQRKVKSLLCLPIWHKGQITLVLYMENNLSTGVFTRDRLELLELLSGQMAISLENAQRTAQLAQANLSLMAEVGERRRTEKELQRRNRELTLFNRVVAASTGGEEEQGALDVACRELAEALEVPHAQAALLDEGRQETLVVAHHASGARPASGDAGVATTPGPAVEHVLASREAILVEDATSDPRLSLRGGWARQLGVRSLLGVPLLVRGTVVGALELGAPEPGRFSEGDARLVQSIADQVSGVLTRISLHRERQRLESQHQQAQRMEALGRLTGGVAHDFNNLLTVILGASDLLLRRADPSHPSFRELDQIRMAARRAAALTSQLLAFSRQQILQPQVLDLNAIVSGLEDMLRRLLGADIDLVTVLDPQLGRVRADATQLEQVVVNLAVNARDAMPGGGALTIETHNVSLDETYASQHATVPVGEYVLLSVSDTGLGMDAATQARVFEPFFTTKAAGRGWGLGLATTHGIVNQSGGHIGVYSEVGHGTRFKVYLPRVQRDAEEPKPASRPIPARRATETILLLEDQKMVRELVQEVLAQEGYRVLLAADGTEARQASASHRGPIHLLVADVVVSGGGSGVDVARDLVALRPELRVLYVSGYTAESIVRRGVLEPGINFLAKPFTPAQIAAKVREVLDAPSS